MTKIEKYDLIGAIAKRADDLGLLQTDRISLFMDLELAEGKFNLRLESFLNASKADFAHDIVGIQRHIDRGAKEFTDCFLPRFAGKAEKTVTVKCDVSIFNIDKTLTTRQVEDLINKALDAVKDELKAEATSITIKTRYE